MTDVEKSRNAAGLTVRLADLPMTLYCGTAQSLAFMTGFCGGYLCDEKPLFTVRTAPDAVMAETTRVNEPVTLEYAESLCLYRGIAERLPLYDRMVFHGAAIEYEGRAYLFTAPSGTGKSTHIALWRRFLGERVKIINGDKPILHMTPDGFTVWGTPYAGKEGWQRNMSAPLAGICLLSQGKDNAVRRVEEGLFLRLLVQTYRPEDKEAMRKTVSIIKALCRVPCCELSCDISEAAVRASFGMLTGENYEEKKV